MSVTCEICGKEFKTSQGLRGHKTFVHQIAACHDAPSKLPTETTTSTSIQKETIEHLLFKVEKLEAALNELASKVNNKDKQINIQRATLDNAHLDYQKLCHEISSCRRNLHELDAAFQRLNRFIQYEVAGVEDDVIWELYLNSPELKRRVTNSSPK